MPVAPLTGWQLWWAPAVAVITVLLATAGVVSLFVVDRTSAPCGGQLSLVAVDYFGGGAPVWSTPEEAFAAQGDPSRRKAYDLSRNRRDGTAEFFDPSTGKGYVFGGGEGGWSIRAYRTCDP